MLISYPILGLTTPDDDYASQVEDNFASTYPVSSRQRWHGGIHLCYNATVGNEPCAIADGKVIAYRIPTRRPNDNALLEAHPLHNVGWTDDGFVLLKHEKESGENTRVVFYSLYMHLSELSPRVAKEGGPGEVRTPANQTLARKTRLGKLGYINGKNHRMHFEIFTDNASLDGFFKRGAQNMVVDGQGNGNADLWGQSHFVIPAGTAYATTEPQPKKAAPLTPRQTDETLCVSIGYSNGDRHLEVCRENGERIGRDVLKGAEYQTHERAQKRLPDNTIYKRAQKWFPDNTSAGYELLRFGRVFGPDALPAEAKNWQCIPLGFGRSGWIDLNQPAIKKLSDADFPYWQWTRIREGETFNATDGKCEAVELLQALDADGDGVLAQFEFKRFLKIPDNVQRLRRAICEFPSEWDATDIDVRWSWLKDYFRNPPKYQRLDAIAHKKWLEENLNRAQQSLPKAQADLKTAKDAKADAQTTREALAKAHTDQLKQIKDAEKHAANAQKNVKAIKARRHTPEELSWAEGALWHEQEGVDYLKDIAAQQEKEIANLTAAIAQADAAIKDLQHKIEHLKDIIDKAPAEISAAQTDIDNAEKAMLAHQNTVDENQAYADFSAHVRALAWWDKVKGADPGLASPTVWHFHPLEFIRYYKRCGWLSKGELKKIYPDKKCPPQIRARYRKHLNRVMFKYGVNTPTRQTHFLGQGAVESQFLTGMLESSNKPYRDASAAPEVTDYYRDPRDIYYTHIQNYDNLPDNIEKEDLRDSVGHPVVISGSPNDKYIAAEFIAQSRSRSGDGMKFRGRGMKQLTGRYNYAQYWVYRGWLDRRSFDSTWWPAGAGRPPIINDPQRIGVNDYNCIDAGGWFWEAGKSRSINASIAEGAIGTGSNDPIEIVSAAINGRGRDGKPNGLADRRTKTNAIWIVLGDKDEDEPDPEIP